MTRVRTERLVWAGMAIAVIVAGVVGSLALSARAAERPDLERKSFISGADVARDVMVRCERGPVECDAALRQVNGELRGRGLMVMEDGSVVMLRG